MWNTSILKALLAGCISSLFVPACLSQGEYTAPHSSPEQAGLSHARSGEERALPRFGFAVSVGSAGAGLQAATAIARRTNVRAGFNYFKLSLSGADNKSHLTYDASLRLESVEVLVDEYVKGPFHVSGGAMIYDGFQGSATVQVPGGQKLTLNNVNYVSAPLNPVTGTGTIAARKFAPEVLFGFGNLLPRSARHITAGFEIGVAFQGSPNAKLDLFGGTCAWGAACTQGTPISSNPTVQSNIAAQQQTINNDLKPFQFYPVVRLAFGYKF